MYFLTTSALVNVALVDPLNKGSIEGLSNYKTELEYSSQRDKLNLLAVLTNGDSSTDSLSEAEFIFRIEPFKEAICNPSKMRHRLAHTVRTTTPLESKPKKKKVKILKQTKFYFEVPK